MARVPGFPGALAPDATTGATVGGRDAEVVELLGDPLTAPAVHGKVVIDTPDHVCGGEVGPHGRVVGNQASGAAVAGRRYSRAGRCRRYSGLRCAARFMPSAERSRNLRRSLAAMTAWISNVERVLDVLVGGAEGDADATQTPSRCVGVVRSSSRPRRSARTTQIWEKTTGASITDKRAATRPVSERDGTRDAVVLVVLEDVETRFEKTD